MHPFRLEASPGPNANWSQPLSMSLWIRIYWYDKDFPCSDFKVFVIISFKWTLAFKVHIHRNLVVSYDKSFSNCSLEKTPLARVIQCLLKGDNMVMRAYTVYATSTLTNDSSLLTNNELESQSSLRCPPTCDEQHVASNSNSNWAYIILFFNLLTHMCTHVSILRIDTPYTPGQNSSVK